MTIPQRASVVSARATSVSREDAARLRGRRICGVLATYRGYILALNLPGSPCFMLTKISSSITDLTIEKGLKVLANAQI